MKSNLRIIYKLWDLNSANNGKKNILFQQNISLKGLTEIGMRLKSKLEILMAKLASTIKKFSILFWKESVRVWKQNGNRKLNFQQKETGKVKVILENHPNFTMKISNVKETLWITEKLKKFFNYIFSLIFLIFIELTFNQL